MDTLDSYMTAEGLTDHAMATRFNLAAERRGLTESVSHRGVQKWRAGQRVPRRDAMRVLFWATGGRVQPNSFWPELFR